MGWVAALVIALVIAPAGVAQEVSCSKPIAPCKACHTPDDAREMARCLAEPWVAPASARNLKNPFPVSREALDDGAGLYSINCEGCHGARGDGLGPVAVKFSVPSLNIGAPTVQAQTDGELFWKISNGRGAMPAWSTILSDEDCWKLVVFVRSFQKK